jgi:peptide/nickel transport system permease protein
MSSDGLAAVIVNASIGLGLAVFPLSALSFMGLEAKPPIPEWGAMVITGPNYLLDYWRVAPFRGQAIFLALLVFSLLGTGSGTCWTRGPRADSLAPHDTTTGDHR